MNETDCRKVLAERAAMLCERCGQQRAAEMHHRKNRSQGGAWTPANILHLCSPCHVFVTQNPVSGRDGGWCLKSFDDPEQVAVLVRDQLMLLRDDCTVEWVF